jgi:hypothetical protein
MGIAEAYRNGQIFPSNPENLIIGYRFEYTQKTILTALRRIVKLIIEDRFEAQIVEAPSKETPGITAYKSARNRNQSIPEKGKGDDY